MVAVNVNVIGSQLYLDRWSRIACRRVLVSLFDIVSVIVDVAKRTG